MTIKSLSKFHKAFALDFKHNKEDYLNNFLEFTSKELSAKCYLFDIISSKKVKLHPNCPKFTNFIEIEINNKSKAKIKNIFKSHSNGNNPLNTQLIIKPVPLANGRNKAFLLAERNNKEKPFSEHEEGLLEGFADLLSLPLTVFESKNKIKTLQKKNESLVRIANYHFPNSNIRVLDKSNSRVEVIYLAIDIRGSSKINQYLLNQRDVNAVIDFYNQYKEFCHQIAVEENKAWYRRQIGDELQYAWKDRDVKNAILSATQILNNIEKIYDIPIKVSAGIGISRGSVWPDYEMNELKGDCPRLAHALQEGNDSILLDFKPHKLHTKILKNKGWTVVKRKHPIRKTIKDVWEIRKNVKGKINVKKENTLNLMKFSNRMYGDSHLHLEGVDNTIPELYSLLEKSVKEAHKNPDLINQLENITNKKIQSIVDELNSSYSPKNDKEFSFQEFLAKLFSSKIILATNPKLAEQFIDISVSKQLNKYKYGRFGLVPSIPIDFPHLDREEWNNSIYKGLEKALEKNTGASIDLVIETKRFQFEQKHNKKNIYKYNLEFLDHIYNQSNPNIDLSISICDDASKYPLFNQNRFKHFEDYLSSLKKYPSLGLSMHMLETVPDSDMVDWGMKGLSRKYPDIELEIILTLVEELEIGPITWVHMSNLFSGIPYKVEERDNSHKELSQRGKKHLKEIIDRNDRIVVCYSSNKYLGNPFLLDYPEVIQKLICGKINIVLGTDDPAPFLVSDISEELINVKKHLIKRYSEGLKIGRNKYSPEEIAQLAVFALIRNSWRKWNNESNNWQIISKETLKEKLEFDIRTFKKLLNLDICPNICDLPLHQMREDILIRELD